MPSPPPFLRPIGSGVFELRIRVVPGASRSEVSGVLGDRLKIRVAAPAEGGKANRAVIALLGKALGVAAREVEIVSGHSSRDKTLRVRGDAGVAGAKLTADS